MSHLFTIYYIAFSTSYTSSGFIAFFKSSYVSDSFVKNTPGQSNKVTYESNSIRYIFLVCPGLLETLALFFKVIEFINELFPTLGYPTIPTVTCYFIPSTFE